MKASRRASAITEFGVDDLSDVSTMANTFHLEFVVLLESVLESHGFTTGFTFFKIDDVLWFVHLEIGCCFGLTINMFLESTCYIIGYTGVVGSILCLDDVDEIQLTNSSDDAFSHDIGFTVPRQ